MWRADPSNSIFLYTCDKQWTPKKCGWKQKSAGGGERLMFLKVRVSVSQGPEGAEGDGNLDNILSTNSRCRSWFSRLIRSCMAASWLIRLFCISLSWSINLCSRASSCACMAASISLSWATVADTNVETCSMTVVLRLFFSGTVYAIKRKRWQERQPQHSEQLSYWYYQIHGRGLQKC